jgi:hypothetical protein
MFVDAPLVEGLGRLLGYACFFLAVQELHCPEGLAIAAEHLHGVDDTLAGQRQQ